MTEELIVLVADDDWHALQSLAVSLGDRFCILMARNAGELTRFAEKFKPQVVLIGDSVSFGSQGAEKLVRLLVQRFDAKVIVLSENGTEKSNSRWIGLGACDCLPHPTKVSRRLRNLEQRIVELSYPGHE